MPAKRKNKYEHVKFLYNAGLSLQDIAKVYKVSRQTIHSVLKRRGVVFRDFTQGQKNFYRGGYRSSKYAQGVVDKAIRKGILIRPETCESCGKEFVCSDGRSGIQAHHCDYNKPLEVMWLCVDCHYHWHQKNVAIERR